MIRSEYRPQKQWSLRYPVGPTRLSHGARGDSRVCGPPPYRPIEHTRHRPRKRYLWAFSPPGGDARATLTNKLGNPPVSFFTRPSRAKIHWGERTPRWGGRWGGALPGFSAKRGGYIPTGHSDDHNEKSPRASHVLPTETQRSMGH